MNINLWTNGEILATPYEGRVRRTRHGLLVVTRDLRTFFPWRVVDEYATWRDRRRRER